MLVGAGIAVAFAGSAQASKPPADGRYGYITNFASGNVAVWDRLTGHFVAGPIATGPGAAGLTYVASTHQMWVANQGNIPMGTVTINGQNATVECAPTDGSGSVSVIDTYTNEVVKTFSLPNYSPVEVLLAPDKVHIYVTMSNYVNNGSSGPYCGTLPGSPPQMGYGAIESINMVTGQVDSIVTLNQGSTSYGAVPTETGVLSNGLAYTANFYGNFVSVTDVNAGTEVATIPLPGTGGPAGWLVGGSTTMPDGVHIYFDSLGTNNLIKYDSQTGALTVISLGAEGQGVYNLRHTANGKFIYVSAVTSGNVLKFNTETNIVVATVAVPLVSGVFIGPDEKKIYSASFDDHISTYTPSLSPLRSVTEPSVYAVSLGMAFNSSS